jgi:hypothetical protein
MFLFQNVITWHSLARSLGYTLWRFTASTIKPESTAMARKNIFSLAGDILTA